MKHLVGLVALCSISFAWGNEKILSRFVGSSPLETASVGVCIIPMKSEAATLQWQADLGLMPASTMKAITTATALEILGADYVFETKVYLKGDDLVVKGGGDPTLGSSSLTGDFVPWLKALKEKGITEIKGDLLMDDTHFESQTTPNEWPWGDVGNYYGAGPSGLNYHQNLFTLTFQPGSVGGPAKLSKVWPKPPGVEFENHMRTGSSGSGDQGYVYSGPRATRISMRGTIPAGGLFSIKGALPDPPQMCGVSLKKYLEDQGMSVAGEVRVGKVSLSELTPIYVLKSPSLAKISKGTNYRSVNLYADSIFKALTKSGTTQAAAAKVRSHWKKLGVDLTGYVMQDGSGLSPRNTVTARQIATILKKARREERGKAFYDSLPVAGQSGTLATFGRGTAVAGRVRAKSGSLTRVRTYTGYLKAKSGDEFAFAVFVNNEISSSKLSISKFLGSFILKN